MEVITWMCGFTTADMLVILAAQIKYYLDFVVVVVSR